MCVLSLAPLLPFSLRIHKRIDLGRSGDVAQSVACLPSICEILGLIPVMLGMGGHQWRLSGQKFKVILANQCQPEIYDLS